MKDRFYKVIAITWFLIMNLIFFSPRENIPFFIIDDRSLDQWFHFGAFAILTGLVLRSIYIKKSRKEGLEQERYCHFCFFDSSRCMILLIAYFALLSELIQGYFVPGKTRELSDIFLNIMGILIAWGISSLFNYWERSREVLENVASKVDIK